MRHGPLDAFSAYDFEDFFRYFKRGWKDGAPIPSFMNRLDERLNAGLWMFASEEEDFAAMEDTWPTSASYEVHERSGDLPEA